MVTTSTCCTANSSIIDKIAGKNWQISGNEYTIGEGDAIIQGAEGWVVRLSSSDEAKPDGFLKFFHPCPNSGKRIERAKWLVDHRIDLWGKALRGAPSKWIDTRVVGRPDGVAFDFCCPFTVAVPGRTWHALKYDIFFENNNPPPRARLEWATKLVEALAILERNDFVHGDVHPWNLLINTDSAFFDSDLYLIDFDAFYSENAGQLASLSHGDGGALGHEGYYPREFHEILEPSSKEACPFSDRHARDMLLIEFLAFQSELDFESPPFEWDQRELLACLTKPDILQHFPHLHPNCVFENPEIQRPTSTQLAQHLGLKLPAHARVKQQSKQPRHNATAPRRSAYYSTHARIPSGYSSTQGYTPLNRFHGYLLSAWKNFYWVTTRASAFFLVLVVLAFSVQWLTSIASVSRKVQTNTSPAIYSGSLQPLARAAIDGAQSSPIGDQNRTVNSRKNDGSRVDNRHHNDEVDDTANNQHNEADDAPVIVRNRNTNSSRNVDTLSEQFKCGVQSHALGMYWLAADCYREAILIGTDSDLARNNLAWLLATCPDAKLRNGEEAARLAVAAIQECLEKRKVVPWYFYGTLAAAYAECDEFESAVFYHQRSICLCPAERRMEQERRLQGYLQRRPFRESKVELLGDERWWLTKE